MHAPERLNQRPQDEYWATVDTDQIANQVRGRKTEFYQDLEESGRMIQWRRACQNYFGLDGDGQWKDSTRVRFGGEQGELALLKANHFRSLCQHTIVLATSDRPAWQPRATNSDYKSAAQTMLAENILDYYMSERRVEDVVGRAAEYAVVASEGWVEVSWDMHAGEEVGTTESVDPETGEPMSTVIKEGDVHIECHAPWNVIHDLTSNPDRALDWAVIRRRENRWELAARYPEHAAELLAMSAEPDEHEYHAEIWFWVEEAAQRDKVEVLHFYHARTDALPEGRHTISCGDVVLFDGPLPYDEVPLYPMIPSIEMGAGTGYANAWDLLSIQQVHDSVVSTAITNHDALGVQNIMVPDDANLDPEDLGGGLRAIRYNASSAGKVESLDLLRIADETFSLMDWSERTMSTLIGINEVVRGNPGENVKSGAFAALLQAQALQFNSGLQKAWTRLLEKVGTAIIRRLQTYATTPRMAEVVGKDQRPLLREFTGESLDQVRRVVVDVGNPITKTLAGKMEVAQQMLANGLIETPEQFFMVLTTGRLEPLYSRERSQLMSIKSENERLAEGNEAPVLVTDDHVLHIQEHLEVLDNPDVRTDDAVAGMVLAHIQEHKDQRVNMDPILAEITGQRPLESLAAMASVMGGGGQPPANDNAAEPGAPPPANDNGGESPRVEIGGTDNVAGVGLPQMPKNPATGERVPTPEMGAGGQ